MSRTGKSTLIHARAARGHIRAVSRHREGTRPCGSLLGKTPAVSTPGLPLERLTAGDRAQDQQEHDGAEEREHDAADVEASHVPAEESAPEEAADHRAEHAHDDVAQDAEPS